MPKGYWIARVDVSNEEGYRLYAQANPAIFKKYGGRFVVRGGKYECPEGSSRSRNVVIEFRITPQPWPVIARRSIRPTSGSASSTPPSTSSSSKATTARSRATEHDPG